MLQAFKCVEFASRTLGLLIQDKKYAINIAVAFKGCKNFVAS